MDPQSPSTSVIAETSTPSTTLIAQPAQTPALSQIIQKYVHDAAEASKLAILALFSLYVIGFVIWHTHLARFGVFPAGLVQLEFLSAALCYLFLVACLALPPAVILRRLLNKKLSGFPFRVFCLSWCGILFATERLFFLRSTYRVRSMWNPFNIFLIAGILHVLYLFLFRKKKTPVRLYTILHQVDWMFAYFLLFILTGLLCNPAVDTSFLLTTILFYVLFDFYGFGGISASELWRHPSTDLKPLAIIVACLLFLTHIYIFGSRQFAAIPKSVGGGLPETALISLSPSSQQLIKIFNLPTTTNGLVGPVQVLAETDRQIVFTSGNITVPSSPSYAHQLRLDLVDAVVYLPNVNTDTPYIVF